MKKFLMVLSAIFVTSAHATTVNIDWYVDNSTYAQTTCETGGNFSVPTPAPTKYGYHLVGWQQDNATGSWSRSGTPSPDNPIWPTFKQFGNTVLRAVGTGDYVVADTYDALTGKITRRVKEFILDGTENWGWQYANNVFRLDIKDYDINNLIRLSTHYDRFTWGNWTKPGVTLADNYILWIVDPRFTSVDTWKSHLASEYENGTPVTIYYVLKTPFEEDYNTIQ